MHLLGQFNNAFAWPRALRHLKRLALLAHHLAADGRTARWPAPDWRGLTVVEIGGGNGNMARLALDVKVVLISPCIFHS